MVADPFVYHPSVAHYLKFVATTAGRDKLLRTIQYFARFYAWYLFRKNRSPSDIAPFEAIKKQFGLARKLMRVGKNIEHFKAASIAADAKNLDPIIKYCAIGRQLGYAGYLTLDSLTYLDVAGIRKSSFTQALQREANRCWMLGLLFSTVSSTYNLYSLKQQERHLDKKNLEGLYTIKKIENKRFTTKLQLISDLCDLTIPTSAIGLTSFEDGTVGLAGTISSLIGVYSQWEKTV
ncbi:peroxisomal biogenesis factor (PEX11) [Blumeria hordei DH14]|uniref:Peroxisomal biogenesis factor (PEX11) n=1 Tax=Blumeria graminis f. sp. hordei (strain DH14) TaxID=546991 RepID=N1J735_BLUG1|nr:peroxisomal biogenesis factor (PEX11) [Blumeria hordei DH14]